MPLDRIFSAGSLAKAYVEIAEWYGKHTLDVDAREILVPFSGFGRMASAMCTDNANTVVCDYQHLHTAIILGIFAAPNYVTYVDKPRFHMGQAVNGNLRIRDIDQRSAGFIDWVVKNGSLLDKACLGMSIPGQTMRGWLTQWTGSFDKFWTKFEKTREECKPYISMPGKWHCVENDFFRMDSILEDAHFDVVAIDPPRLTSGKDGYTTGSWARLNQVLGGHAVVKPWTRRNYFSLLHLVMNVDCNYVLFSWTKGDPATEDVKKLVLSYGTLEDEQRWDAYQKEIYSWRIKKGEK
jgi:hypothetical protein